MNVFHLTLAKLTVTLPVISTPYASLFLTVWATRAAEMRALDGTQPTLRQSPPIRWFSMRATYPNMPPVREKPKERCSAAQNRS